MKRISIFNDIKAAYELRSVYLHGQKPEKKKIHKDNLTKISIRLDELLRATLTMIIMCDSEIFQDEDLRSCFLKYLIMGESAYLLSPEYIKWQDKVENKKNKENQNKNKREKKQ